MTSPPGADAGDCETRAIGPTPNSGRPVEPDALRPALGSRACNSHPLGRGAPATSLVTRALRPLLKSGNAPILSCLVDEVSRHDERLLDELERLVREKRREQGDR